jgi:hypothetical protein
VWLGAIFGAGRGGAGRGGDLVHSDEATCHVLKQTARTAAFIWSLVSLITAHVNESLNHCLPTLVYLWCHLSSVSVLCSESLKEPGSIPEQS